MGQRDALPMWPGMFIGIAYAFISVVVWRKNQEFLLELIITFFVPTWAMLIVFFTSAWIDAGRGMGQADD